MTQTKAGKGACHLAWSVIVSGDCAHTDGAVTEYAMAILVVRGGEGLPG